MNIALISIGNCPSLALRNIRRYCLAHEDPGDAVSISVHDYDIEEFQKSRTQSSRQWSFITKFDEAVQEIARSRPSLIAFSCYLWNTELSLHLAHLLKRIAPEAVSVFGGPDAGPRAKWLLQTHPHVDFVVEGDGEIAFLELTRRLLRGGKGLREVPGLRYREGGEVVENPPSSEPVNMSLLSDLYEGDSISSLRLSGWRWPYLMAETLRGCPYACSYCMYGKTRLNEKDPEAAVKELSQLLDWPALVEVIDPTFTTYQKRAKHILRRLGEKKRPGRLTFEVYPDSIDEEMADLLQRGPVGCLGLGFQTISSIGLKAVKRPKNLARFERAITLLRTRRVQFYVDIIYGLPGTTLDDFLATVDYLHSLGVNELMIYRLLGLPGSPMMADAAKYRMVFSEFPPYELLSSDTFSLEEILYCERFRHALADLRASVPEPALTKEAQKAGGISKMVARRLLKDAVPFPATGQTACSNRAGVSPSSDNPIVP